MLLRILAVAGWAAVSVVSAASAQSLAGPAELPPSAFKGSQYVDSRGCVFLRAGIGGRVTWVPRISRNRQALCGQSPAAAARELAVAAPEPAPQAVKPIQTFGRAPMETIASLPRTPIVAAPRVMAQPAPQPTVRTVISAPQPAAQVARPNNGCPASSPYGARVTLSDGRVTLLCSPSRNFDAQAAAARMHGNQSAPQLAPRYQTPPAPAYQPKAATAGAGYKCPSSAPVARRFALQGGGSTVMCTTAGGGIESATPPLALGDRSELTIPKGYRAAWSDGRLNPQRGIGTARGQAQQDQVWTRDVPAQLAAKTARRTVSVTSTSNATRNVSRGGFYVQVGTFGEAANAARSAARLQGLGLPVTKSRITSKGRSLQIVLAGPFGDSGTARAALSKARRSGFGDAFIR